MAAIHFATKIPKSKTRPDQKIEGEISVKFRQIN